MSTITCVYRCCNDCDPLKHQQAQGTRRASCWHQAGFQVQILNGQLCTWTKHTCSLPAPQTDAWFSSPCSLGARQVGQSCTRSGEAPQTDRCHGIPHSNECQPPEQDSGHRRPAAPGSGLTCSEHHPKPLPRTDSLVLACSVGMSGLHTKGTAC